MKLDAMKQCAAETLSYFIQTMPDVPFSEDDIIFSFAKKSEMIPRIKELCAKYCPDKILNESQYRHLRESVAANALIGREKSAVLVRIDSKIGKKDFRRIIYHELIHIFCALTEIDGEHFIDIYGSGTTPDCEPEEVAYDGMIVAGYTVWAEFIAQYYAVKMIDKKKRVFTEIAEHVSWLLRDVHGNKLEESKGAFSMICAYWLNCIDLDKTIADLAEPGTFVPDYKPYGAETQNALRDCIVYIHNQMQRSAPWKISKDFIFELGYKFSSFRVMNSLYLSH